MRQKVTKKVWVAAESFKSHFHSFKRRYNRRTVTVTWLTAKHSGLTHQEHRATKAGERNRGTSRHRSRLVNRPRPQLTLAHHARARTHASTHARAGGGKDQAARTTQGGRRGGTHAYAHSAHAQKRTRSKGPTSTAEGKTGRGAPAPERLRSEEQHGAAHAAARHRHTSAPQHPTPKHAAGRRGREPAAVRAPAPKGHRLPN